MVCENVVCKFEGDINAFKVDLCTYNIIVDTSDPDAIRRNGVETG